MNTRTVLVVDPDPDSRTILSGFASSSGCRALSAASADVALDLARRELPDLIITAVCPSRTNGSNFLEALRADPLTARIRVIGTTTVSLEENLKCAERSGCSKILTKPITFGVFKQVIEGYLAPLDPDTTGGVGGGAKGSPG